MSVSPKFPARREKLLKVLTPSKLTKSWKNDVRVACRHYSLLDLLDHQDIHANINSFVQRLIRSVETGTYKPKEPMRVLSEKSKGLCRQLLVPDPIDALLLQALVDSIYPSVKNNEPTKRAYYQPQSHIFSSPRRARFSNQHYGGLKAWLDFQKQVFGFAKTKDFLVVTDIANYYDFVDLEEIRRIYVSFNDLDEDTIDLIFYVLGHFHWYPDYMPKGTRGLPQTSLDAPRLLAHSFLFELDSFLERESPGAFVRYMDDIDVGVDSIGEAKRVLRDIDNVLRTRGVRLNSGKSQIMTSSEALEYYFVDINSKLDILQRSYARKMSNASKTTPNLNRERTYAEAKFKQCWRKRGFFNHGQGDKVLKRFLGFSLKLDFQLPDSVISNFIRLRPSLRDRALQAIAHYGYSRKRFRIVGNYVTGDLCVDEASLFTVSKTLVDLNCPRSQKFHADIAALVICLLSKGRVGIGAALWVLSKYGTDQEVFDCIFYTKEQWQLDHWLGRQVGSLAPRFKKGKKLWKRYFELIRYSRNEGAQDTLRYHLDIQADKKEQNIAFNYLKVANPSQPRKLAYQKILLLMSFLMSNADAAQKAALRDHYDSLSLDRHHLALLKGL